jgi:hypothetical protein
MSPLPDKNEQITTSFRLATYPGGTATCTLESATGYENL